VTHLFLFFKNKKHTKGHPHLLKNGVQFGLVDRTKFILNSRSFRFGSKPITDGKFIEWVSPCWIIPAQFLNSLLEGLVRLKLHFIN